jgi:molybdenum storage protein
MSEKRQGKIWIEGMDSPMIESTLAGRDFREDLGERSSISILPDIWVVKIGGQSIMDRGKSAVLPILEQLVAAHQRGVRFILCTGGGTRARHVYALGLDLNLPTGMLARLGGTVPVQNARMLQLLMAKHGGIVIYPDDFDKLPFYLNTGCIPITSGMPPNEFWEKSAAVGLIPSNRTDAGVYLLGEFLGAKGVLFIKDEDGLYTDDPKKNPEAEFIADISAQALLDSEQDDLIIERIVLEYLTRAEKARQIQIINGLKPDTISAAFDGEPVGTIIRAE